MELVTPTLTYKEAFCRFYNDFVSNDPENADFYKQGVEDFPAYIQTLSDEEKGLNLRLDYVPCSHFWLVDDHGEILGAIRIRHRIDNEFLSLEAGHIGYDIAPSYRQKGYGKAMLKMVLPKALELGIEKAMITADEDNLASRKVIEANGGEFQDIVIGKVFPDPIARYWVPCVN